MSVDAAHIATVRHYDAATGTATVVIPALYGDVAIEARPFLPNLTVTHPVLAPGDTVIAFYDGGAPMTPLRYLLTGDGDRAPAANEFYVTTPAEAGPRDDTPTLARFGHVSADGRAGFIAIGEGSSQVIMGNGKALAFYQINGASYDYLGRVYPAGGIGALDMGGWTIGRHPVHTGFYGLWILGATGGGQYAVMSDSATTLLNASGTVYIRVNNVTKMSFVASNLLAETPYRATTPNNVGVDGDPISGAWYDANFYASSPGANVRIGLRASSTAYQLRVLSGQAYISCVNEVNTGHGAFAGKPYITLEPAFLMAEPAAMKSGDQQSAQPTVRLLRPDQEQPAVLARQSFDEMPDIVPEPDIMALRPVAFRSSNSEGAATTLLERQASREVLGLPIEDLMTAIPSAVTYDADGQPVGITYDQVTVALLDHVQQLTDTVEALQQRVAELETSAS